MNPVQGKARTRIIVIGLLVVAALVILGGAGYAIYSASIKKTTDSQTKPPQTAREVDFTTLKPGLESLQEKSKKSSDAHQKAKEAMNDEAKRIKLDK